MLRTPRKRRYHAMKKRRSSSGSKGLKEALKKSSDAESSAEESEEEAKVNEFDHITTKMSSLNLVPTSIRFGKRGFSGFAKRKVAE